MKFSVLIVNYASWPLTLRCIASLQQTRYGDFETFVVDNDSVEPPELPSWVRLIRNEENVGFARAHNRGIAASNGDPVVLINPDTLVKGDFFKHLEEFVTDNPRVGIAGPRILDSEGGLQLSARREISALSGFLGRTSLLTRLFPKSSLVKSQFPAVTDQSRPTSVDWVSGACMVVRRETLRDIGPLDERFFMYFEDADLCRRARAAGWLVYYLPHVEIVHQTGASSRSRPKAIWLLHKSAFLYHRKYGTHGPFGVYSAAVLAGLTLRALAKLGTSLFGNNVQQEYSGTDR
ncbi:MAG: dTDP-Rha:A-D-GlcNAc-diphosphoryl polyprenol, A-3-L-rhamnosyl transferase WbbL [uncultured Rubrobacteraceae bacterium]|uniref:dTDP-Rha:A-D-GlcNAc-diphosphoryl polyprenol, A-3-L-rhamnosyl transferase WbbL n=1 Tax=uncultured Rubrobacteraceae bacterium TaxID=349277 RepID=A0A6J4RAZ6_9ACTN|nr:MAG: dTDP-Rha:A-D-GlcNAc-diphosphoryl polyprenol, A-3-L-rhamnosyl transferase WbbL [uncultured Rubrobacteraceae bacterium]